MSCLWAADNAQHIEFPAGGTLHVKNSSGELDVEGWDQPGVEISSLESVHATIERHGNELDITSVHPKHDLEYRIRAPRNARIVIDHYIGEVYVDDMTGDIRVTDHMGDILLHLPEDHQYSIDAKSKIGDVNSDFPGDHRHTLLFGDRFAHDASTAVPKIYLRVGFGDILILKIRKPPTPAPLAR